MNGPSLSWSKSRYEVFNACKTQYLFQYYDYWNGWRTNAPLQARRVYFLKNLKTADAVIGLIAHTVIGDCLREYQLTGNLKGLERLYKVCGEKWDEISEFTVSRRYRNKKGIALSEFNYGMTVEQLAIKIDESVQKTKLCLSQFYSYISQKTFAPGDILTVDDSEAGFLEVTVDGTPLRIYSIIDFTYLFDGNKLLIIDWKTGLIPEEDNTGMQALNYGIYANQKWQIEPNNIFFEFPYLATQHVKRFQFSEQEYNQALIKIEEEIRETIAFEKAPFKTLSTDENRCKAYCSFLDVCPKFAGRSQIYAPK